MPSFCPHCGTQANDGQVVCLNCGRALAVNNIVTPGNAGTFVVNDNAGFGTGLISFLIPIVGIILYFSWKNTKPKSAKLAIKWAAIGFIANMIYLAIFV